MKELKIEKAGASKAIIDLSIYNLVDGERSYITAREELIALAEDILSGKLDLTLKTCTKKDGTTFDKLCFK